MSNGSKKKSTSINTPVCDSYYMFSSLKHFTQEKIFTWFDAIKTIDSIIDKIIKADTLSSKLSYGFLSKDTIDAIYSRLPSVGAPYNDILKNIQLFEGYRVYEFPDNKEIQQASKNPDLWYGIAKASKLGTPHIHKITDSFNYILDGGGIFCGIEEENTFDNYYHKQKMMRGCAYEIPAGMSHGHLVTSKKPLWLLFVQECGLREGLACEGDIYPIEDYDFHALNINSA